MTQSESVSHKITQRSKSNLAFALSTLSKARKRDMITFYAFCRVIDDIADEPSIPVQERRAALDGWKDGLLHGFRHPDELQKEVYALTERYHIDKALLAEIVDGVGTDLTQTRYETYDDLLSYCYKVASVVGLVSIEIFGYKNPACKKYAVSLGYALQLTNIIRDVGEDAANDRIYLPLEDLRQFNVREDDLKLGRYAEGFGSLMAFEHARARAFYDEAKTLLPPEDKGNMLTAEMMGKVYSEILEKIRRKGFRVFERRIGLGKLRKLAILGAYTARGMLYSSHDS